MVEDDEDEEVEEPYEVEMGSEKSESDYAEEEEEDEFECDEDLDSEYSESSYSTISSRKRWIPKRPKTPELDEKDIPQLELPSGANDLIIDNEYVLQCIGIFEVLRHFRTILRLSPFRLEDFCMALAADEQNCLLAETHISLMRALQREEEGNNTTFGPHDLKDSINISLYFLDAMTWPEVVKQYLESDRFANRDYEATLKALQAPDYCTLPVQDRLCILQTLTDLFLTTNAVREEIMNEGNIQYDDHCRSCHK